MKPARVRLPARLPARLTMAVVAAATMLVSMATRADAQGAEDRCKAKLSAVNRLYVDRVLKARTRCENNLIQGSLPLATDCLFGRGDDRLDKKLRRAELKLGKTGSACNGVNLELLGFPGACEDETGDPFDTVDFQDCVFENTDDVLSALLDTYYPPIPDYYHGNLAECLVGSPDDGSASLQRKMRARERCLAGQDVGTVAPEADCYAQALPYGEGTGDETTDRGVARAYDLLLGAIPLACAEVRLEDLGYQSDCDDPSGGAFTLLDLKRCLFDANRTAAVSVLGIVYPPEGTCGDGIVGGEEQCDDGPDNSDTAPNACREDCTSPVCHDGITDTGFGEQCDDGNTVNGDCCSGECVSDICGDGTVNCGEECDDGAGNSDNLPDSCREDCTDFRCGDGTEDTGEECDDGAGNSDTAPNACRADCTDPFCHDGVTDGALGEQCDDGNTVDGDCCSGQCMADICGDGVVNCAEECDDGPDNSDTVPDACRTDCRPAECTDGTVDSGEECDDGNLSNDDDCNNLCVVISCGDGIVQPGRGEQCDDGVDNADEPDKCRLDCQYPTCPDGIVDTGEVCDDGNSVNGDGCDDYCGECQDGVKQPEEECDGDSSVCPAGEGCNPDCSCEPACPTVGELVLWAGVGDTCDTNADCEVGTCDNVAGRCKTTTQLDSGWLGLAHNADINNEVRTRGLLECDSHGPVCGECNLAGLDPEPRNCRCADDITQICNEPFVEDADDCAGAVCNCYFGAPFPLNSGGTPACILNRFVQAPSGVANVDEGAGTITANLRTQVYLGIVQTTPCPYCGGTCSNSPATLCNRDEDCGVGNTCTLDPVADDGVRGGTCVLSDNEGAPCDVMGTNSSYVAYNTGGGFGGSGYSLDCPPAVGKNISGTGIIINLTQTTGTSTLEAHVSCQGNSPELECPCMVCSSDKTVPCNSDAECAVLPGGCSLGTQPIACSDNTDCASVDVGTCNNLGRCTKAFSINCANNSECLGRDAGTCVTQTCSSKGSGDFPLPNICTDQACSDLGGGVGECTTGPDTLYCDALLKANGRGIISCQNDGACTEGATEVVGGAGSCTLSERTSCFVDPITLSGDPDPSAPIGVSAFCIPPTPNTGINSAAGLPGPGRIINQSTARTFCADGTPYVPGAGGCIEGQQALPNAAQSSPGRGIRRGER